MNQRERRYKVLNVPQHAILDLVLHWKDQAKKDFLFVPDFPNLPADCEVVQLHLSWQMQSLGLLLWSSEWPIVPSGETPPNVEPEGGYYEPAYVQFIPKLAIQKLRPQAGDVLVIKYPRNLSSEDQRELMKAAEAAYKEFGCKIMTVPGDFEVELLQAGAIVLGYYFCERCFSTSDLRGVVDKKCSACGSEYIRKMRQTELPFVHVTPAEKLDMGEPVGSNDYCVKTVLDPNAPLPDLDLYAGAADPALPGADKTVCVAQSANENSCNIPGAWHVTGAGDIKASLQKAADVVRKDVERGRESGQPIDYVSPATFRALEAEGYIEADGTVTPKGWERFGALFARQISQPTNPALCAAQSSSDDDTVTLTTEDDFRQVLANSGLAPAAQAFALERFRRGEAIEISGRKMQRAPRVNER